MRCWISVLAGVAVAGCSVTAPPVAPLSSELCNAFVEAWVGHFKANVARLDGQTTTSLDEALRQSRQALLVAGQDEAQCQRPYCIVQPRAGGRLDSYCGYRIADPGGNELYRWVPWAPARR
ncbi:hypothetical protein [Pseudomonas sp. ANT_H12B]|uniref:hypothetical protein n=1 Tax=Pseudomonas sp. ANT_H12B TaxID=2597348 RepID=UPI0011EEF0F2|nr:hypothetical protein [Pseudomonas sp. ANT_H12B]KAA0972997.1 hypothetical protein FQ185_15100 [Pseudomonas sp. ANT_H12B]